VEERRGRNNEGLPLTIWLRDFGHPTLFSILPDQTARPIAALDVNIVIDLAAGASTTSDRLTAEWMRNAVLLAVTDEVLLEIDTQQDVLLRKRHRRYASGLSKLHADTIRWENLFREMQQQIPNADKFQADLRHAARAAAGGARWFVTRDGRFERACAKIVKAVADVEVVSPGEFLVAVDALVRGDMYRPTDLHGSSLQLRNLEPGEFEAAVQAFVNPREGERFFRLRQMLDRAAPAGAPSQNLRVLVDGEHLLGLIASTGTSVVEVPICRVHRGRAQSTIARQLVAIARAEAADSGALAVRLADAHCGEWVRRAASAEGYVPAGAGFIAIPIAGMGNRADLIARAEAAIEAISGEVVPSEVMQVARSESSTVAAEELFHPWRMTSTKLPTFVLSIEPVWAAELFDIEIARGTLFPRQRGLTLQREHVYYRNPAATGGLTAPARILWYVKGGPAHDRGVRAVSTLRDVVVGDPRRLYRRFAHLGVFDEAQVLARSDGTRVMALCFSHTSMLPRSIPLDEYRAAMRVQGVGLSQHGPQRLPEHVFDHLATLAR